VGWASDHDEFVGGYIHYTWFLTLARKRETPTVPCCRCPVPFAYGANWGCHAILHSHGSDSGSKWITGQSCAHGSFRP
jgi:hypothetical protein